MIQTGRGTRTFIPLNSRITIGAANTSNLVISGSKVSKVSKVSMTHAMVVADSNGVYLLDLNSTNGTLLNGKMMEAGSKAMLVDGDVIRAGESDLTLYPL
jgi:pSer/pThr/pTyr-binding forkhead associated (FHA) protein